MLCGGTAPSQSRASDQVFSAAKHEVWRYNTVAMQRSTDRILTTHTGSLPRPPALRDLLLAKDRGEPVNDVQFDTLVSEAVQTVVRRQAETGIDVVSDGEMSKYSWLWYMFERLDGFAPVDTQPFARGTSAFGGLGEYGDLAARTYASAGLDRARPVMACVAPVRYANLAPVQRDLATFRAAVDQVRVLDAFVPAVAPGTVATHANRYYQSEKEYMFAIAEAMRVEFTAIVDAGFIVQLDEPGLVTGLQGPRFQGDVAAFRAYVALCIKALNHSVRGIPRDRVSLHVCWGNLPGPHHRDTPLELVVDLILGANVGSISVEAWNPRHEHEWHVWETTQLPDDIVLIPGMIDSKTNYIEHPRAIADRLVRYASVVGRENIVASTDCGLGSLATLSNVEPEIAWAKLGSLVEGARLASDALW
jgi:5-methyltetrahydropteroyltriglutamate--homocysteine methyltransferase